MSDLKLCYETMASKNAQHSMLWRYYDGDHPISFLNEKFNQVFKNGVVFKKNWCPVVVNTSRDRLKIQEWLHEDATASEAMGKIWKRVLRRIATDVTVSALATGEGYIVAWPGKDGQPKAYYHDPRQVQILFEDDDPDTPRVAAKVWKSTADNATYLNLYYTDRIEHYYAKSSDMDSSHAWSAFRPTDNPVEGNPYGVIPVFQFRPQRRTLAGELTKSVLSIQDALNKLLNDMMVTSEYASFNQRWAIGNFDNDAPLPIGPGTTAMIPPGVEGEQAASTGVYPSSGPGNYLESMGALTNDIAAITAIPRHYFEGQGANISGEALQTMEGPLVAKVLMYQDSFGETWTNLMSFMLGIEGIAAEADDIECIWADPHTVQPQSLAQTRLINTQAGIPIINQLRDEGWTAKQLDELRTDAGSMPQPAQGGQFGQPAQAAATLPRVASPEEAAPRFEAIVKTPDIAGEIARSGMLTRAINRRNAN